MPATRGIADDATLLEAASGTRAPRAAGDGAVGARERTSRALGGLGQAVERGGII